MSTGFYLLDHRNPHGDHFYKTRKRPILAGVLHITAGLQDLVGADASAEKTAAYAATTDRAVSWHSGVDADSYVHLLPASFTAWHASAYNSPTWGVEVSKTDTVWADEPPSWVDRTLVNLAACVRDVPELAALPPRRATRAELDAAIALYDRTGRVEPVGWVAHADLDPERRSDPGRDFPYARFFDLLSQEDDDMPLNDLDKKWIRDTFRDLLNNSTEQPEKDAKPYGAGSWATMTNRGYRRLIDVETDLKRVEGKLDDLLTRTPTAGPGGTWSGTIVLRPGETG